jgi:hypothetical protein
MSKKQSRRSHRMRTGHGLLCGALVLCVAATAQAGPAMFSASFIMHAFGNDVTTGTAPPSTSSSFFAMPLGHDCHDAYPFTTYGAPSTGYCSPDVIQAGAPASGSGSVSVGSGSPASVMLPQSAFGITTTGELPSYYPHLKSTTYATFVNAAGRFFAGGGPAAGFGQKTKTGMGQRAGTWRIHEGPNAVGGVMGILGALGAHALVPAGTRSWNMIRALGRVPYATPTAFTSMGKATNWLNPHISSRVYTNSYNGKQSTLVNRGSGTPWTTGSVTVYATAGVFTTILHRAGYDTVTPSGARNLQLVTPALTHWIGPGFADHTGHIGILKLAIAPEPGAWLSLALGLGLLLGLRRVTGRF